MVNRNPRPLHRNGKGGGGESKTDFHLKASECSRRRKRWGGGGGGGMHMNSEQGEVGRNHQLLEIFFHFSSSLHMQKEGSCITTSMIPMWQYRSLQYDPTIYNPSEEEEEEEKPPMTLWDVKSKWLRGESRVEKWKFIHKEGEKRWEVLSVS